MARKNRFQFLRSTRANLNTQASANALFVGEPYLITDENRLAVGLTVSTYESFVKSSEIGTAAGQSQGSFVTSVANRTALAALNTSNIQSVYLRESGREGTFVWTTGNLSAMVTADTQQGLYVAPSSDTTGTSGAWVRKHFGFYDARWFGFILNSSVTGDKTTNRTALSGLLTFLAADGLSEPTGSAPAAPLVRWPVARIHLPTPSSTDYYEINVPINWEGMLPSHLAYGATGTTFVFDTAGFRFNPHNLRNGVSVANTTTSSGSRFVGFRLTSIQARPSSGNYAAQSRAGLLIHAQVQLERVFVDAFTRDGIAIVTSGTADSLSYLPNGFSSNADLMIMHGVSCFNNGRHGLFLDGVDSNACSIKSYNGYGNNNWDIYDSGFLANAPSDCHSLYNGMPSISSGDKRDTLASVCTYATNRYYVSPGQAAAASTTTPGTNSAVWVMVVENAGSYTADSQNPAWVSGMTWKEGGCYYTETYNSQIWINCYAESGQGGPYFKYHGGMIGGTWEPNPNSVGFFLQSDGQGPIIKAANFNMGGSLWVKGGYQGGVADGQIYIQSAAGNYYPRLNFMANNSAVAYSGPSIFGHPDIIGIQSESHRWYNRSGGTQFMELDSNGLNLMSGKLKFPTYTNSSPSNGEIWFDGTTLKKRIGGVTTDLDTGGSGGVSDGDKGDVVVGSSGAQWIVESATPAGGTFTVTGAMVAQNASATRYQIRYNWDVWVANSVQLSAWDNVAGAGIQFDISGSVVNLRHGAFLSANTIATGMKFPGVAEFGTYTNASPANGQIWFDGTTLKKRLGGVTTDLDTTGSGYTFTNTSRFYGRITAGGGAGEELTGTQATTLLDTFTSTLKGLVPSPGSATKKYLRDDGSWFQDVRTITFIIDGGGSAITTGIKGDLEIPFGCTINSWTVLADQSGSIVIDVWKDTYAQFPPTVADTITASAKPTLSSSNKNQNTSLVGWTTAVAAGSILRFNVDSAATVTRVTLSLKVTVD